MKVFKDSVETNIVGAKIRKTSERIEACGNVDELNSFVGLSKNRIQDKEIREVLKSIQSDLWIMGADLADPRKKLGVSIGPENVERLEKILIKAGGELEPLKNFLLTFQTPEASLLDACRTISRRTERHMLRLQEKEDINKEVFRYINRLSDVFFALSRLVDKRQGKKEEKWVAR